MSMNDQRKRKHRPLPNRYKITYASNKGTVHYSIIIARDADIARQQFINYFSSPGDEIKNITLEPREESI